LNIEKSDLLEVKKNVYDKVGFVISDLVLEAESKDYQACRFELNGRKIICRSAKITPKKVGYFVTFWKRKKGEVIEPFNENDIFDFYIINLRTGTDFGQFVIPKAELIKRGIISTSEKEGKRGFRVYAPSDIVTSKQAEKTQKWQRNYFLKIDKNLDFDKFSKLYDDF
jgi:hypothetical protein